MSVAPKALVGVEVPATTYLVPDRGHEDIDVGHGRRTHPTIDDLHFEVRVPRVRGDVDEVLRPCHERHVGEGQRCPCDRLVGDVVRQPPATPESGGLAGDVGDDADATGAVHVDELGVRVAHRDDGAGREFL